MAVSVKKIVLWRKEVENRPGALAGALASLAQAGADLQIVMGYRYPGEGLKAAIELYPVTAKKSVAAAQEAGLAASSIPALLVEGDNKPGLGHMISQAIADAGINIDFLLGQVVGRKYSAVLGLDSEEDATKAVPLIRKAVTAKRR
jgi:hypothetical protein